MSNANSDSSNDQNNATPSANIEFNLADDLWRAEELRLLTNYMEQVNKSLDPNSCDLDLLIESRNLLNYHYWAYLAFELAHPNINDSDNDNDNDSDNDNDNDSDNDSLHW